MNPSLILPSCSVAQYQSHPDWSHGTHWGQPGTGKTTLIHKLLQKLTEDKGVAFSGWISQRNWQLGCFHEKLCVFSLTRTWISHDCSIETGYVSGCTDELSWQREIFMFERYIIYKRTIFHFQLESTAGRWCWSVVVFNHKPHLQRMTRKDVSVSRLIGSSIQDLCPVASWIDRVSWEPRKMVKVELTFLVPSSVGEMVNSHGKPIGFIKSRFSSQNQPGSFKQRRVEWSVPIILARLIGGTYSRRLVLGLYYEFWGCACFCAEHVF